MSQSEIESQILKQVEKDGKIENSLTWANSVGLKHDETLIGVINKLTAHQLIAFTLSDGKRIDLTQEGEQILKLGSHEYRAYQAVPKDGISKQQLESNLGEIAKVGINNAMKLQWIGLDKSSGLIKRIKDNVKDETKEALSEVLKDPHSPHVEALKKRKLLAVVTFKIYSISKGPKFSTTWSKAATDLTSDMLSSGSWRNQEFKELNFNALGRSPQGGYLHPLLKVRAEFREIFLEMGFEEMPTNNFVESSFWNFDALFQPQQHPARDAHDTFFLNKPSETLYFPEDYVERVKEMHSKGGHNSIGWRYDWKFEETKKNILRTHTTAISSRMLYKLARDGFKPKKYFSIDRVFRNEATDNTHLAEFHQIEGVIADYNLTLGHLMGVIGQFWERLGIPKENIRFKPAYNPYTEPSMEIFSYHSGLKKWVEIGNSGVFRPEMLLPMGLPEGVRVLAWGLSLERPTMIRYKIDNIRDLVGHKLNLEFVEKNPICRLDK